MNHKHLFLKNNTSYNGSRIQEVFEIWVVTVVRVIVIEKTSLYVDTFEEMLNIYDSAGDEKCALKRQRRLWCLMSDLCYPGAIFSCECALLGTKGAQLNVTNE